MEIDEVSMRLVHHHGQSSLFIVGRGGWEKTSRGEAGA